LAPPKLFAIIGPFMLAAKSSLLEDFLSAASFLLEESIHKIDPMETIVMTRLKAEAKGQLRAF
jgi:hypothetical protein